VIKNTPTFAVRSVIGLAVGLSLSSFAPAALAQSDAADTLPDAKPGECYAKVITPAKFATRSEEVVVQEASERVETIPAKFDTAEQTIVVREASRRFKVIPATYGEEFEKVQIRPAESSWTLSGAGGAPASPGALEGIVRSGIQLANVETGTCFREFYTQPEYKTETSRVLVKQGSETISVSPAAYETVEERVVVKEAYTRSVDVPATYRTESESVLVEPARSVWKKGRGPIEKLDNITGEIMCLVEIPARYETLTKTVLDKPATSKTVEVPAVYETVKVQRLVKPAAENRKAIEAEYENLSTRVKIADAGFFWLKKGESANDSAKYSGREVCLTPREAEFRTIKKTVVKTPARTEVIEIPAKYKTVKVTRLISPATERRTPVPARTKTVSRQVQVEPSRLQWRQILCETNTTPKLITSIQRALRREGFDPGPIDGVIGADTLEAIQEFQLKNSLDSGGITFETLKALKVNS